MEIKIFIKLQYESRAPRAAAVTEQLFTIMAIRYQSLKLTNERN